MELLGLSMAMIGLFVGFGLLIGVLFGFFGMGGSFLVTPALLVMGYPTRVAVGSGLAFVFGTSVIATLKHRDLGQVDYKLGLLMIVGTTAGIEVGKETVVHLESLGLAGSIISVTYVFLLGGIGAFVTYEAVKGDGGDGIDHDAAEEPADADDIPDIAKKIQSYNVPPMIDLRGGADGHPRDLRLLRHQVRGERPHRGPRRRGGRIGSGGIRRLPGPGGHGHAGDRFRKAAGHGTGGGGAGGARLPGAPAPHPLRAVPGCNGVRTGQFTGIRAYPFSL